MMRNRLKWLPVLALVPLLVSSCGKDEDAPQPEPTTYDKEVTFHIFTDTDYRDARWDDSKMKLSFSLRRTLPAQQKETVVLDTTLGWIAFRQLPAQANKLQLVRKLNSVSKAQEDVVLHVSKVVSINGYETLFTYSQSLDAQKPKEVVEIKL